MAEPAIHLLPYQRRWLDDQSRFKAAMITRQGGKTKFMAAIEVVEDVMAAEARGEKTRWIWLSRGERQALDAMDEAIKPLCEIYHATFSIVESEWRIEPGAPAYKSAEITFAHGSKITALPANPDTARGFTANMVLDEFAIHQDSRKIWAACFPIVSRRGLKLRVLSTPNGITNKFWEIISGKDATWSRHVVDIYQAVEQGLDRDIEELRAGCGDADVFAQEYELKPLDEASAWLPIELILSAEHADAGLPAKYAGGPCFAGNDIATRGDLWVTWVWEVVGDVLWTREIRVIKRGSFAEHDAAIAELFGKYKIARLAMDQTGMGEKPVEDTARRYPGRVEGVLFTATVKQALALIGKARFEARTVRIPAGDLELRADLHKIKKIVGPTGMPRFLAESDSAGHADRAWAAFLGISAADPGKYPTPEIFVGREDETDDEDDAYVKLQQQGADRFAPQPYAVK